MNTISVPSSFSANIIMKEELVYWDISWGLVIRTPFVKFLSNPKQQTGYHMARRDAAGLDKIGCIVQKNMFTKTNFIFSIMMKV